MSVVHLESKAIHAARYGLCLAACGGDLVAAERLALGNGWSLVATCIKSLIGAQTAADFAAATAPAFAGFIESLRSATIVGRLGLRPVPLNTRTIVGDGTAVAAFADEGQPKPLTAGAFTAVSLPPRKCTGWAVLTQEVLKASHQQAENIVLAELRRAVVQSQDQHFIDPTLAGSVTNGAPTVTSTGSDLASIDHDLKAVLLQAGDMVSPQWVLHPMSAVYLSGLRGSGGALAFPDLSFKGGQLMGVPAITSSAVARTGSPTEKLAALIDSDQVLLADDGETELTVAKDASVMMVSDPSSGAASLVSLWQNSLIGLRAERWLAWHVVRSGAVVVLGDLSY
jgi:HK97 family phage major capsid protein